MVAVRESRHAFGIIEDAADFTVPIPAGDMHKETMFCGTRRRFVSSVRVRLALELTDELGLWLAETARQLGVSTSAIGKILERNSLVNIVDNIPLSLLATSEC
jgi:hypothetical protein